MQRSLVEGKSAVILGPVCTGKAQQSAQQRRRCVHLKFLQKCSITIKKDRIIRKHASLHVAPVKIILQAWPEYFTTIIKYIFALGDINIAL